MSEPTKDKGLTGFYRALVDDDGATIRKWTSDRLLTELESTALMLATDGGMRTNAVRIALANDAYHLMRREVLLRMTYQT